MSPRGTSAGARLPCGHGIYRDRVLVPPTANAPVDPSPRQLSPKIRTVWRVRTMGWTVGAGGMTLALGLVSPPDSGARVAFVALGLAFLVVGSVAAILLPNAFWSRWAYAVLPDVVDLEHGLLNHRRSSVPYFRVQHIDLRSGPIERSLGLTNLVIRTASATSDSELPGLATEDAEELRRLILARAGQDDAV